MFNLYTKLDRFFSSVKGMIDSHQSLREEYDQKTIKGMGGYSYVNRVCTLGFQVPRSLGTTTFLKNLINSNYFGDREVFVSPHNDQRYDRMFHNQDVLWKKSKGPSFNVESWFSGKRFEKGVVFIFTEYNPQHVEAHRKSQIDSILIQLGRLADSGMKDITVLFFSS